MKLITTKVDAVDNWATGQKLKRSRKKSGLRISDVASAMGISEPYLSELERGKRNWTQDMVDRFNKSIQ